MSHTPAVPLHGAQSLKKCLCQLCSCGCHRCPHLPNRPYEKNEKPCMLSEYMERYPLYPITVPRGSFKSKDVYKMAQIAMEGISTTKRDYIAHQTLPLKRKPPEKYVKNDVSMDLTSTYKKDYNAYPISQVPPCFLCVTRHIPNVKMDTRTTYEDDYVLWNEPKLQPIRPNDRFQPSEEKFDHRTTVQADYLFKGPVATQSCKPLNLVQKTKAPFDNVTNYRVHYVPLPLKEHHVHKYQKYKANKVPFDGLTTHKVSYKGLAGRPAKLAKPYQLERCHDLPFLSTTEFQEKYQAWPQPPIFPQKPDVYVPPLEKMDLCTTTQMHYKYSNGKPAKICRVFPQIKKSTVCFNGSSTMKDDYKPWLCKRRKPIIHAPKMTFPAKPVDYLTTFKAHYVPHPLKVTKRYKPVWSGPKHPTLLDAKTTYATSYTPKCITRCLASYEVPPGYVFEETDAEGHNIYIPASKSGSWKVDTEGKREWIPPS